MNYNRLKGFMIRSELGISCPMKSLPILLYRCEFAPPFSLRVQSILKSQVEEKIKNSFEKLFFVVGMNNWFKCLAIDSFKPTMAVKYLRKKLPNCPLFRLKINVIKNFCGSMKIFQENPLTKNLVNVIKFGLETPHIPN